MTECKDNEQNCQYWANQGYCRYGGYVQYMKETCAKACGLCTGGGGGTTSCNSPGPM